MQPEKHEITILVVDDDAAIRKMVTAFLETAGYRVIVARDGEAGLDRFTQFRHLIALLPTDVEMPRMNGLDPANRVLEIKSSLPVLFMSCTHGAANRGYGCVEKPFRRRELLARVGAALELQAA